MQFDDSAIKNFTDHPNLYILRVDDKEKKIYAEKKWAWTRFKAKFLYKDEYKINKVAKAVIAAIGLNPTLDAQPVITAQNRTFIMEFVKKIEKWKERHVQDEEATLGIVRDRSYLGRPTEKDDDIDIKGQIINYNKIFNNALGLNKEK